MRLGARAGIAVVVALAVLAVPAGALAAAPANDNFASREVLSGSLPIEVTRSNMEATKEEGEFFPSPPAPAGHSIWFEWEATATEWISVGVCGTAFPVILGVLTGTEVDHLTSVLGNNSQGPRCPDYASRYTFKAISGTKYVIVADGNLFHLPEAPPPVTAGPISLKIEATPPPPNDDFSAAALLEKPIGEEPGGARFYSAPVSGYNWGATREGEDPGDEASTGASVWYRWSPPETATYRFSPVCCGSGLERTVYSGSALGALSPLVLEANEASLSAGTTYYIGVAGEIDSGSGEPRMGSFEFFISAELPPLPEPTPPMSSGSGGGSGSPPRDSTAPDTKIDKTSLRAAARSARFWFSASEPVQGFLCRLDKAAFKPCGSPRTYKRLKPGRHAFRVKSVDLAGNADGSAAVASFRVPRPQKRH